MPDPRLIARQAAADDAMRAEIASLRADVDVLQRELADRIGGPTTVVKELEIENRRLRVEVQRLTASLKEADDERLALKEHYPKLRADLAQTRALLKDCRAGFGLVQGDLAAARAERDGLAKALDNLSVQATSLDTAPGWVCVPEVEWDAAHAALPKEEDDA